jgi:hypothetical protein
MPSGLRCRSGSRVCGVVHWLHIASPSAVEVLLPILVRNLGSPSCEQLSTEVCLRRQLSALQAPVGQLLVGASRRSAAPGSQFMGALLGTAAVARPALRAALALDPVQHSTQDIRLG